MNPDPLYVKSYPNADSFLLEMLSLGKPLEISLVGVFDSSGRGSRRDIELPYHQDGVYSAALAEKQGGVIVTSPEDIDVVGLYCIRNDDPEPCYTTVHNLETNEDFEMCLVAGEALVIDNKRVLHGRRGRVGDTRLLIRAWIKRS